MVKVHVDTDLGGDIDDLCALAMLLRRPDVEIAGITTVAEVESKRAGYVRYVLNLEQRRGIPVAAGADVSATRYRWSQVLLDEQKYWGEQIAPSPNLPDQAIALLKQSIEQGAIVVGIGPFTNLYLLEKEYPGILEAAPLFLMGGYVYPITDGFPQMSNTSDYNIQVDVQAAQYVIAHSNPTLIPLTLTVETALRRAHLHTLRNAGALGQLLARQAEAFALDEKYEEKFGKNYSSVPNDIINFLHDPLACAVATGWNKGVEIQELPLKMEMREGWLYETINSAGKPTRVVTRIDGNRFNECWIKTVSEGSTAD